MENSGEGQSRKIALLSEIIYISLLAVLGTLIVLVFQLDYFIEHRATWSKLGFVLFMSLVFGLFGANRSARKHAASAKFYPLLVLNMRAFARYLPLTIALLGCVQGVLYFSFSFLGYETDSGLYVALFLVAATIAGVLMMAWFEKKPFH